MMTKREQAIFMKGIEVGMKAAQTIEDYIPKEQEEKEQKKVNKWAKKIFKKRGPHVKWTTADDIIIENMTADMKTDSEIAKALNRKPTQITNRRLKLGIVKGKNFKSKLEKGDNYEGLANVGQKINE